MRTAVTVLAVALALTAGCVGGPGGPPVASPETADTPETTVPGSPGADETPDYDQPWPNRTVEWPEGPKERPDWPADPDADSVAAFVREHEYNYVYNSLWYSENSEVEASCEEPTVDERGSGWVVSVTCTGYSDSAGTPAGDTTLAPHADWFTQTYRYRVDEDTILRERVSMGERSTGPNATLRTVTERV